MSEVDRLSNSGLYPALPIADRHRDRDESAGRPPPDSRKGGLKRKAADDPGTPRPPSSIIDEYA